MTTYPIVSPVEGGVLDPAWGDDITDAVNDHQTRLSSIETLFVPQVSWTTAGTVASSGAGVATEQAMASWAGASASFLFRAGWVHELGIQVGGANYATQGAAGRITIRVRKGVATTSGQQLALLYLPTIGNQLITNIGAIRYIKNATGADITTALGVTCQQSGGAGSGVNGSLLYGDADTPLMLSLRPLGLSTTFTGFASVASSIV